MDVNRFISSLDIFRGQDEKYVHAKTTAATTLSLLLLFLPASALRWDGSIRNSLDRQPLTKAETERLQPNAILNRSLRILSVMAGLGLASYSAMLDYKDLSQAPLRRKKREAQRILEDETINAQIIELLPAEKEREEAPALSPQQHALSALLAGSKVDGKEDILAIAKSKFTVSEATADVPAKPAYSKASASLQQAMDDVTQPSQDVNKFDKFRLIGEAILRNMVISDKSVLIASGTGTGKTTTERYLLRQMQKQYPGITFYALLQKNDALPGVKLENALIFQPASIDRYIDQGDDDDGRITLNDILRPLYTTYQTFLERKNLPTEERERLRATAPIRCILGDWFGTHGELESRLSKKDYQRVLSMLRQIITVGRDSGVGLIVDTQSANLSDLGLAESASIRQSLDIYAQGFVAEEFGQQKGELKTMRLLFENPKICDKDEREQIMTAYQLLREAIQNREVRSPIIFTTVGSNSTIGIVPHLEVEREEVVPDPRNFNSEVQQRQEQQLLNEDEANNPISSSPFKDAPERHSLGLNLEELLQFFSNEEDAEEEVARKLNLSTILHVVDTARIYPVTLKQIQSSRYWKLQHLIPPGYAQIRELCNFLVDTDWLKESHTDSWIISPKPK